MTTPTQMAQKIMSNVSNREMEKVRNGDFYATLSIVEFFSIKVYEWKLTGGQMEFLADKMIQLSK